MNLPVSSDFGTVTAILFASVKSLSAISVVVAEISIYSPSVNVFFSLHVRVTSLGAIVTSTKPDFDFSGTT